MHEFLAQTGDENCEYQRKLRMTKCHVYLRNGKIQQRELNKKIQELENQLEDERSARKELELLIEKKAFNIETVKDFTQELTTMCFQCFVTIWGGRLRLAWISITKTLKI